MSEPVITGAPLPDPAPALDHGGPTGHPFRRLEPAWIERPVVELFAEVAARRPDQPAIDDGARRWTFAELHALTARLAARLHALLPDPDPDPRRPIGIALPIGAHFPAAMLATLAVGRPYVPMDIGFPAERNREIAERAGLGLIVTDRATIAGAGIGAGRQVLLLEDLATDLPAPALVARAGPDDLAYIIYTSGSTGRPKGVVQDQRNLLHDVMQYVNAIHLDATDGVSQLYSPSVNGAIRDIFGALLTGATLYPIDLRRDGFARLRQLTAAGSISVLHAMPPVFRAFARHLAPGERLPGVRLVYLAGDRIFAGEVDLFNAHCLPGSFLYLGIGSTENATIYRQWFLRHGQRHDAPLVPVGYPVPERRSVLLRPDGRIAAPGEEGEIVVTSRHMALGYWNDPELTALTFTAAPDEPGARVLRTGDLGRERADGLLEFLGRRDRQVKIRGFRVEPAEVEAVLRRLPGVADAAVIGRDMAEGVTLAAFVEPAADTVLDETALMDRLAGLLPAHLRPATIRILDPLPRLPNLKHDLATMAALAPILPAGRPAPAMPDRPEGLDAVGEAVRAAWLGTLGAGSWAPERSFAEAGGDSLKALELLQAMRQRLGYGIAPASMALELRPPAIEALLRAAPAPESETGAGTPRADLPLLLVVPGAPGASLADLTLMQDLASSCRVEFLPLPTLEEELVAWPSIEQLGRDCALRAAELAAGAPLRLLGISFGGRVAWEVAVRLGAFGHEVAFLGLVDIPPLADRQALAAAGIRYGIRDRLQDRMETLRCQLRRTRLPILASRLAVAALVRLAAWRRRPEPVRLLLWLDRWLSRAGRRRVPDGMVLGWLRQAKVPAWSPPAFPGTLTLFRCGSPAAALARLPADLGWSRHCRAVAIVRYEGDHAGYAAEAGRPALVAAIAAAMVSRERPAPGSSPAAGGHARSAPPPDGTGRRGSAARGGPGP